MGARMAFFRNGSKLLRCAASTFTACLLGTSPAWGHDFGIDQTPDVSAHFLVADTAYAPPADTADDSRSQYFGLASAPIRLPSIDSTEVFAAANAAAGPAAFAADASREPDVFAAEAGREPDVFAANASRESDVFAPDASRVSSVFAADAGADWDLFAANAGAQASSAAPAGGGAAAPCLFCRDYWGLLKSDVKHVFTGPVRWDGQTWLSVGWKALVVVGTMAVLDDNAADYIDSHKSSTSDRIADAFEPFGREYAALIIGGYLAAGKFAHKPKAKQIAVDGFTTTLIAAGLITTGLKKITGRSRPNAGQGPHDFHPFTGGQSFPSGHTTAAFSVAATIAQQYDALWVKGLSYGVATMVGYARMEKDAHWLSDVTAGAMIGVGVARSVHNFNKSNNWRGNVSVAPINDPGARGPSGIALSVQFALR